MESLYDSVFFLIAEPNYIIHEREQRSDRKWKGRLFNT